MTDAKKMMVIKRNGASEAVDLNKILRAVTKACDGLSDVDPMRVATKTISGLYDGATTAELDRLSIQTAAELIAEEPEYSKLAARLLSCYIDKEVRNQNIQSFSQSVAHEAEVGLAGDRLAKFVSKNARKLNALVDNSKDSEFEYFGIRTVYDRYLLKDPTTRLVVETPQYFFLRIACAIAETMKDAVELYHLMSSLDYLPSSPTLFNSGARREQLSSCFLLDSPEDDLIDIYKRYSDIAQLSKYSGGIGVSYSRVRSRGSLIKGTNGHSNGIIPWLKTLDSSVSSVNQGGRRPGACCVYLETWHADIEEFLQLRDNTGDHLLRAHNLNLSNWIPDLFMERVDTDSDWSLFDPKAVPTFPDIYGQEFTSAYLEAEAAGLASKVVKARDLYAKMMRTLAQTGNGWMTFKDRCNVTCAQTAVPGRAVHLSNLCTEILEVTSSDEFAVCNLGSINLSRHMGEDGQFDFKKLGVSVRVAIKQLDRVIDLNLYLIPETKSSNSKWRPVGLGLMGLQDVFFKLNISFDSQQAQELSRKISEEIYYHALSASADLAEVHGSYPAYKESRSAAGELQFDYWEKQDDSPRWIELRKRLKTTGLRNSLMIAIAPTATIASIAGCYECIEPQISNLFKRETLSGEFIQINKYLVSQLKSLGMWTDKIRADIKMSEGSIQGLDLPESVKDVFRTAWEQPMKALIDMAAARGAYIDQSQSLNLFMESPTIGKLSSMYMYAWKKGLKTTYYLRSRPATKIAKTIQAPTFTEAEAVACSLENPTACEACQ